MSALAPRMRGGPAGGGLVQRYPAEWRKMQRTWSLPLVLLGPLGVTLMGVVFHALKGRRSPERRQGGVPLFAITHERDVLVQVFSLMLGTALLASQLADVEHRSDTWKQLFAMPVSRARTFAVKLVWLVALLAVASVLMVAGYAAIWVWQGSARCRGPTSRAPPRCRTSRCCRWPRSSCCTRCSRATRRDR